MRRVARSVTTPTQSCFAILRSTLSWLAETTGQQSAKYVKPEMKLSSGFTKEFAAQGPRDKQGRSLRDFDLETRLFKHPCSYLIYSEAFDALPDKMKAHLYQRLWNILSGKDPNPEFAKLTAKGRKAVLEILADTKPGLPDYWKTAVREKDGAQGP